MPATSIPHPFDPLTEEEIKCASALIRQSYTAGTKLDFRSVSLFEPDRSEMEIFLEVEHAGKDLTKAVRPAREAVIVYYLGSEMHLYEAIVDITNSKLVENVSLPAGTFANMSTGDVTRAVEACMGLPAVQKEIERLKIPREGVVCEPWPYGSDKHHDGKRKYQCYMFTFDPKNPSNKDGNYYAFPLDFSPVLDAATLELLEIMRLPLAPNLWDFSVGPEFGDRAPSEYLPELTQLRQDLKPLYLTQPEGASFDTNGNLVEWQKWRFRVGFNPREGLVLYDIRLDGRSAFYRLALSDMFVPYGDPRPPFHRKSAFDFGEAGAGATANSLSLGCDCLGLIRYFDGVLADDQGQPVKNPNVVCMHEQDDLLAWKHTQRSGRAVSTRSRVLILQTMSTLANYEYIFLWTFDQAGGITLEIRATGIMSTQLIALDSIEDYKYGTTVHPGVVAPSHQHIFCMRIDPAVDGPDNEVVQTQNVTMPVDDETNPYGVGFLTEQTPLRCAGFYDTDATRGRAWIITNPAKTHPVTRRPTSWKLIPHNSQMLLADQSSLHRARAGFSEHQLFLTKYNRRERYASSDFVNQSRTDTGVASWARREEDLDGQVVMWHSFGTTHVPRTEDFPIMPIAKLHVKLEPYNFFDRNPAIDVPPSSRAGSHRIN
ncbi:copper/topaquinone oxidase [Aspergillus flavus]|nr:copper/topaquinone oxidase [Aspergillus flavus]